MEEREIVIEPFHGGWLAHYRGDRSYRVTAETPEEARRLLVSETPPAYTPRRIGISTVAVLVCALVAATLVALRAAAPGTPTAQHMVKWAHHHHHTLHH